MKQDQEKEKARTAQKLSKMTIPTEDARKRLGLDVKKMNFAITGATSSGKTSFINTHILNVRPNDPTAGKVNINETLMIGPKMYSPKGIPDNFIRVYDLPGCLGALIIQSKRTLSSNVLIVMMLSSS